MRDLAVFDNIFEAIFLAGLIRSLQTNEEGMPPIWLEWIIAPVFYRLNLRNSDRIRQIA